MHSTPPVIDRRPTNLPGAGADDQLCATHAAERSESRDASGNGADADGALVMVVEDDPRRRGCWRPILWPPATEFR